MNANLIVLKTQETQSELPLLIEPTITQKLAQVGVEVYKTTCFAKFENFCNGVFGLLENNTIILADLTHPNISDVFQQLSKFYQTEVQTFSQGKFLQSQENRTCVLFDLCNTNFVKQIDKAFLHKLFAPTKYGLIFKTFGLGESEVKKVLNSIPNSYGFEFFVTSNFLDCEINILVDADYYKSKVLDDFVRKIYEKFESYIYADDDQNLFEKLMEGFSVRKSKIAICDMLTKGLFFCELEKNITQNREKICAFYNIANTFDLKDKIGMSDEILNKNQFGSDEITYEITFALLQRTQADIALVISGDEQNPRIAIGDNDAIHLYKFHFNHNKSLIDNIIIQNSVFKLLKKLKQTDKIF